MPAKARVQRRQCGSHGKHAAGAHARCKELQQHLPATVSCYCLMLQARAQAPPSWMGWKRAILVSARNAAVALWDMPSAVASCASGSFSIDCAPASTWQSQTALAIMHRRRAQALLRDVARALAGAVVLDGLEKLDLGGRAERRRGVLRHAQRGRQLRVIQLEQGLRAAAPRPSRAPLAGVLAHGHRCYCLMLQARRHAPPSWTGWKRSNLAEARNVAVALCDMPSAVASCGSGSFSRDCAHAPPCPFTKGMTSPMA